MRIPTSLEELSLSFGYLWCNDTATANFDPALLAKSLRQHKDTLRVLDVDLGCAEVVGPYTGPDETLDEEPKDCDRYYYQLDLAASKDTLRGRDLEDDHATNTMGSLRDYTALTRLSISIEALLGTTYMFDRLEEEPEFRLVDALPPNLEYLCLYSYQEGKVPEVDDHVAELMRDMSERFPRLREVLGVDVMVPGVYPRQKDPDFAFRVCEEDLCERPEEVEPDWEEV